MIGIQYVYNNLTLNDDDFLYYLRSVSGFDSPGLREVRENRPGMNGQIDYQNLLGERIIIFNGEILARNVIEKNQLRANLISSFLVNGTYSWLKYQLSGEIAKQVYCKVFSLDIFDEIGDNPFGVKFAINLLAIDPRIYSQEELTKTVYIPSAEGGRIYPKTYPKTYGTIQVGGKIICVNDGNFSVLPIVKMFGPLSNPKIRNNNDDAKEILVNMEVSDGDYLEIDFEEKTIMLNGTTSRYNYLDSDSKWWKIKSGNNEIEFRDGLGNVNGKAEIIFRHSWI